MQYHRDESRVSSDIQTPRRWLKKLGYRLVFQLTSRCLDIWWNTPSRVRYITSTDILHRDVWSIYNVFLILKVIFKVFLALRNRETSAGLQSCEGSKKLTKARWRCTPYIGNFRTLSRKLSSACSGVIPLKAIKPKSNQPMPVVSPM